MVLAINREQLAWAAGVFDGEGWATSARRNNATKAMTATLVLGVGQKHREMLERLAAATGLGSITGPTKPGMWAWRVHGFAKVQAVFAMLWPWLGSVKRDQIGCVLAEARANRTEKRRWLTDPQAREAHRRIANGETQASVARHFGCPKSTIWRLANGRNYRKAHKACD